MPATNGPPSQVKKLLCCAAEVGSKVAVIQHFLHLDYLSADQMDMLSGQLERMSHKLGESIDSLGG